MICIITYVESPIGQTYKARTAVMSPKTLGQRTKLNNTYLQLSQVDIKMFDYVTPSGSDRDGSNCKQNSNRYPIVSAQHDMLNHISSDTIQL